MGQPLAATAALDLGLDPRGPTRGTDPNLWDQPEPVWDQPSYADARSIIALELRRQRARFDRLEIVHPAKRSLSEA